MEVSREVSREFFRRFDESLSGGLMKVYQELR